jgi:hypothetical protein
MNRRLFWLILLTMAMGLVAAVVSVLTSSP